MINKSRIANFYIPLGYDEEWELLKLHAKKTGISIGKLIFDMAKDVMIHPFFDDNRGKWILRQKGLCLNTKGAMVNCCSKDVMTFDTRQEAMKTMDLIKES